MSDTSQLNDLLNGGRLKEAFNLALRLSTAGDGVAQMKLGWMYQVGKGVARDLEQAKVWYRAALQTQSPRAEFYLGTVFWNDSVFPEAISWFEKAASHGFGPAMYQLARMYRHGVGVSPDQRLAVKYVREAAQAGHIFAQRDLAREMVKGQHGLLRIPVGFVRMIQVGYSGARTGWRNFEDDRLFRL
jgi:hypothetical protein